MWLLWLDAGWLHIMSTVVVIGVIYRAEFVIVLRFVCIIVIIE